MVPNSAERFGRKEKNKEKNACLGFVFVFTAKMSQLSQRSFRKATDTLETLKFGVYLWRFFSFGQAAGLCSETSAARWFIEETLHILESG